MSKPEPRFKMGDRVRLIATPKELEAEEINENFDEIGYVPGKFTLSLTRENLFQVTPIYSRSNLTYYWCFKKFHPFTQSWDLNENFFELAIPETPKTSTEITEDAYLLL